MKKEQWVLLSLYGAIGAIYVLFVYLPDKERADFHLYTIGTVYAIDTQSEGSKEAKMAYQFHHKSYLGSFPVFGNDKQKIKKGSRVFVQFSPKNPENAQVIYKHAVPKSWIKQDTLVHHLPSYSFI